MLTFILGGCGTGKSTALMQRMKADLASGKKVLVLVPEQFSFEAEKKLYEFLGAADFNKLQTFSFVTLARHILQEYGRNSCAERYATDQEKLAFLYQAVRRTAERGELRSLTKSSESPGFVENLLALFVKLRKAGVSAELLEDASEKLAEQHLKEKTAVISYILLEYDRILIENDLYDSLTDLAEASSIADTKNFFADKQLYIDEFDSFTGDQYGMLETILAQAENVTAAIRTDEPDVRISPIFEGGNRTYRNIQQMAKDLRVPVNVQFCDTYLRSEYADLKAVSTQILRPRSMPAEYSGHVHIMEASDPTAEAEYICATICRMLSEDSSLRCRDIAIAVKSLESYGSVLQRALDRYELPYHVSAANPILHTELIRHFLSLLAILADGSWDTDLIMRYLKNPFSGYQQVAVSMLEHYCFTWRIDKKEWLKPFYEENTEAAERAKPFGGKYLEGTRAYFVKEMQNLSQSCAGKTVKEICTVLWKHLEIKKLKRKEHLEGLDTLELREFTTLWNMLADVMETIVSCCEDQVMDFAELYDMFRLMLSSCKFSTPPQTLDSIHIVEAQTARLNAPRVVFVPEVNENVYPGEISLSGIFSRQELELLEEQKIVISRMFFELYSDERLIVHKLFSAPSEHLYLSYPLSNAAGEPVKASMIIGQIKTMFPKQDAMMIREKEIPLSYYVRTHASAYFHFVRNLRTNAKELSALRQLLLQHPEYADKVRKLSETSTAAVHQVSPDSMKKFLGDQIKLSPSGIEKFFECPFKYFCNYCLRLYVPEMNAFSNRDVGNYAHYCLEQILRKYSVEDFVKLSPNDLRDEISALSKAYSAAAFSESLQRDGRFQLNFQMSGSGLMKLLTHMQKEMKEGKFIPVGFEVKLDASEEEGTIPLLTLRDGAVRCDGKIDRVDLCQQDDMQFLRVVDYKTGDREFIPEKLAHGLDLQMPIYLLALKQSGRYEHFVSGGVLYMPSGQIAMRNYQDRDATKKVAPEQLITDYYQMKGLIHADAAPLMEKTLAQSCADVYKPSKKMLYSVSSEQMESMEKHIEKKICEMADMLYGGNIAPNPYPYAMSPCTFCGCSDICGAEPPELVQMPNDERYDAIVSVFGEPSKKEQRTETDGAEKEAEN